MSRNVRSSTAKPITSAQIRRIHTIVSILRISDENYRAALESRFSVTSSKDLTMDQAQSFIKELDELAFKVEEDRRNEERRRKAETIRAKYPEPYHDMDNRPGMATGAQLRKIEAMWADVSVVADPGARERALRRFLSRIAGVAGMRFLDLEGASKVINALAAMKRSHNANHNSAQSH